MSASFAAVEPNRNAPDVNNVAIAPGFEEQLDRFRAARASSSGVEKRQQQKKRVVSAREKPVRRVSGRS